MPQKYQQIEKLQAPGSDGLLQQHEFFTKDLLLASHSFEELQGLLCELEKDLVGILATQCRKGLSTTRAITALDVFRLGAKGLLQEKKAQ